MSHSQPFWAHGYPDLAIVHNGHITNYHKMRRLYEQRGVRFYTENDSEIIGVYLADRLSQQMELKRRWRPRWSIWTVRSAILRQRPMRSVLPETPFALKPLLFTETDTFVAVATEEIAIRAAFEGAYRVDEAQAKDVRIWQR